MHFKRLLFCIAALAASATASAAVVTLTFEGVGNNAQVLNYYNGGQSSIGTTGTNYGIAFTANATTFVSNTNFSNVPSPSTVMTLQAAAGSPTAYFNVAAGFSTGFSFFYSSATAASVSIFSGLDGTGTNLGTINLGQQATSGCSDTPFCNWTALGTAFTGTAKSVAFSGSFNRTGFDNLTFGCATTNGCTTAGGSVPEPASLALVGIALAGLSVSARRRRRPALPN